MNDSIPSTHPPPLAWPCLGVLLSCALCAPACNAAPAPRTQALPPRGSAPAASPGAQPETPAEPVHAEGDFTVADPWRLCDKDDLADCTRQCDGGELASCVRLANIYSAGTLVQQDLARAASLYEQPCTHHIGVACSARASILAHDGDHARAAEYYSRGCDGDDPNGCYKLARFFEHGEGVAADMARAAVYFRKACDGDDARACSELGVLYKRGDGVARDDAEAARLFELACEGGNAVGCGNLGSAYYEGAGVPQDCARGKAMQVRACDGGAKNFCALLARSARKPEGGSR